MSIKVTKTIIIFVCVWVVSAIIFAFERSPCGTLLSPHCGRLIWTKVGDAVLLRWVYDFQTLLGGALAFIAGAFVLKASRETNETTREMRQFDNEVADAVELNNLKKRLDLVAIEFNIAASHLKEDNFMWPGANWRWLDEQAIYIAEYDPEILEVARMAQSLIMMETSRAEAVPITSPGGEITRRNMFRTAAAIARATNLIFQQCADEEVEDIPETRRGTFNPYDLDKTLRSLGRKRHHLRDISFFFNWGDHAATPNKSA